MAYMQADTGNKVGFRPYGSTNPQCAAQLSGIPARSGLGQNHPFKPEAWVLHPGPGLGDYEFLRPFDPWELYEPHGLHGLAGLGDGPECVYLAADGVTVESLDPNSDPAQCASTGGVWEVPPAAAAPAAAPSGIPSGTRLTYTASLVQSPYTVSSPANVIAAVSRNLQSAWDITVVGSSSTGGVVSQASITLQLQTNTAYGALSDIKSIVDGAFYNVEGISVAQSNLTAIGSQATLMQQLATAQATGDTPTASAILSLLSPGGAASASAAPMTAIEAWITSNMLWLGIGAAGLLILPNLFGSGRRR
jgi:hypothetical protein